MTVLNVYDLIVTPETRKRLLKQPWVKKNYDHKTRKDGDYGRKPLLCLTDFVTENPVKKTIKCKFGPRFL